MKKTSKTNEGYNKDARKKQGKKEDRQLKVYTLLILSVVVVNALLKRQIGSNGPGTRNSVTQPHFWRLHVASANCLVINHDIDIDLFHRSIPSAHTPQCQPRLPQLAFKLVQVGPALDPHLAQRYARLRFRAVAKRFLGAMCHGNDLHRIATAFESKRCRIMSMTPSRVTVRLAVIPSCSDSRIKSGQL